MKAEVELYETASPDNELIPVLASEIEAILQASPNGEERLSGFRSRHNRIIETYSTTTAFPDIELLYQRIRPDHETNRPAQLRISLRRTAVATGEDGVRTPVSLDQARKKRRLKFIPRLRRQNDSEEKAA
ncbi:MAG TPA: hypothetical protein VMS08_04760 [Candidatus Saccharimonadia bacterium]|nr:hypothetical protein [Candidatus Saccharimonadia bacterium]